MRKQTRNNIVRFCLFLYLLLVLCPIQYWPFIDNADNSWYFAINYAAAHHLLTGVDIIGESGPLGYVAIPQDIGNNLIKALGFQIALWFGVMLIAWNILYRGSEDLRKAVFFTAFLALSAKLYQYPDPLGSADLLVAMAMILIVEFQLRGSFVKYTVALLLLGLAPLIKFVSLFTVAGLVVGIVLDRLLHRERRWASEITLAMLLPTVVISIGYVVTMGSWRVIYEYLRSSVEISSGYSRSMSLEGPRIQFAEMFVGLLVFAIALRLIARSNRRLALFLVFISVLPLALNLKHSIVRQDSAHTMHLFCFLALSLALLAMIADFTQQRVTAVFAGALLVMIGMWPSLVARGELRSAVGAVTGMRTPYMVWPLLPFSPGLRHALAARSEAMFPPERRVEPEIRSIIGSDPVASLSPVYSDLLMDGLHPVLYPVVLRHTAYTPYLDAINADWVRDRGPRYLVFNGEAIDDRHPWTDTPAMWAEVYRWYDLRFLGHRNMLLERREVPRFQRFELVTRTLIHWGERLPVPASSGAVFWSMECPMIESGKLRQIFFRVPEVRINIQNHSGESTFRFLPAVVVAPSLGNYLPTTLAEFAAVFDNRKVPDFAVESLSFDGPGISDYSATCNFEWRRPQ